MKVLRSWCAGMVLSATMISVPTLLVAAEAPSVRIIQPDAKTGSAAAVVVGPAQLVHTGQVFPEASGKLTTPTPPADQIRFAWNRLGAILKATEAEPADVVKLNVYAATPAIAAEVAKHLATVYAGDRKPAVSYVATRLPDASTLVAFDAVAVSHRKAENRVVPFLPPDKTGPAIAAVMPVTSRIYISGQAEAGDGTMADATAKTMASLFNTLAFLNRSPKDVVQVKAFLGPMTSSADALAALKTAFGEAPVPPVSLVEWESSLPIEIELVVAGESGEGRPSVEYLTPPEMKASPVYARVARINTPETIYISGLYAGNKPESPEAEVRSIYATLKSVLAEAGSDLNSLAKATYYVSANPVSDQLNAIRPEFYDPARPPAASKAKVVGTGRADTTLTIDMIAAPAK